MSDFVIVKKDPPPRKSRGGKAWGEVAQALKDSPNEWFSIGEQWTSISSWASRPRPLKFVCVEMVARNVTANRGEIFIRVDSEGPDFEEFMEQVL